MKKYSQLKLLLVSRPEIANPELCNQARQPDILQRDGNIGRSVSSRSNPSRNLPGPLRPLN